MVPVTSLWMPILVSAVIVFLASFLTHMVLTYHRSDWRKIPKQDDVMAALRPFNIPPGDYMMPCGEGPASMKDPAFIERMKAGPVALLTVMPTGMRGMGANLAQWFVFCIVVSIFAAYLTGRALGVGADYREVFRFAGTVAFVGYEAIRRAGKRRGAQRRSGRALALRGVPRNVRENGQLHRPERPVGWPIRCPTCNSGRWCTCLRMGGSDGVRWPPCAEAASTYWLGAS